MVNELVAHTRDISDQVSTGLPQPCCASVNLRDEWYDLYAKESHTVYCRMQQLMTEYWYTDSSVAKIAYRF